MNISTRQNIIAAFLVFCYLLLPVASVHQHAMTQQMDPEAKQTICCASTSTVAAASNDCPCSDEHGQECCDSVHCSCACHIPLLVTPHFSYSPDISIQRFAEPHWALPQVYLPIFVPPQNLV